jgi:hypothetical protein
VRIGCDGLVGEFGGIAAADEQHDGEEEKTAHAKPPVCRELATAVAKVGLTAIHPKRAWFAAG